MSNNTSPAFSAPGAFTIPKPQAPPVTKPGEVSNPVVKEVKVAGTRTRSTVVVKPSDIEYIKANVTKTEMTFKAIADHLGLSENQVKQQVNEIKDKLRDKVKEIATKNGVSAYGTKPVKERGKDTKKDLDDYLNPLSPEAKKVEAHIQQFLSRPENARKTSTEGRATIDTTVNSILADLGLC